MGRIILLVCSMLFAYASNAETKSYNDLFNFREGIIQGDEVWSGKNLLLSDVVVPKNQTLTLAQDSWLIFNEADLHNRGNKASKPELIVHGKLLKPDGEDTVKVYSLSDPIVQAYIQSNTDNDLITIAPKAEPLTDLKENLHESRRYYSWLWVAIYSLWLIF